MFQAINLWPQWSMWHFCDSVNWEIRGFRNISGIFEIFVTSNLVVNKILPVSLFNEAEIMISHFLWTVWTQPSKVLANIPLTHSPNFIPLTHNSVPQLIFLVASLHIPHESQCHRQPSSSSLTICLFIFSSSLLWDWSRCHCVTTGAPWSQLSHGHLTTGHWSLVGPVWFWTGVFAPLEHLLSRFVFSAPQPHNVTLYLIRLVSYLKY